MDLIKFPAGKNHQKLNAKFPLDKIKTTGVLFENKIKKRKV